MLHGEISNRVAPRWLFQFENLIAAPPKMRRIQISGRTFGRTQRRWDNEISGWEMQPYTVKRMVDMYWRLDVRFDLVTFLDLPTEALHTIGDYMDARSVPVGNVLRYDVDTLAQSLVSMPDVFGVVHCLPEAQLKFGGKGWYIPQGSEGWALQ